MSFLVDSLAAGRTRAQRMRAGVFAAASACVLAFAAVLLATSVAGAEPSVGAGENVTSYSDAEARTSVSVYVDSLHIVGSTPDLAGSAEELLRGPGQLQASVAGGIAPYSYTWTRTVDGVQDASFSDAGTLADLSESATHAFSADELHEGSEYVYTLTVRDGSSTDAQEASTSIRVVCSGDYGWRDGADETDEDLGDDGYPQVQVPLYYHDEKTDADIKVAGYLHRDARIVVTPLNEFDPVRLMLATSSQGAQVVGAWVIEMVLEGDWSDADLEPYVGDIKVAVRFPGQETVQVASRNANVRELRSTVRVGETWTFPEAVLFLDSNALMSLPECEVDDQREWLNFTTDVLGAFATLGEKTTGAVHDVSLDAKGGGRVVAEPSEGSAAWRVADGDSLRAVLLPDAGYEVGEVRASNGVPVSVSGNRVSLGPVGSDCTLSVTFNKVEPDASTNHVLSAEVVGGHGAVEPAESRQVAHGQSALVQFLPDAGYVVDEVLVNGVAVTAFADAYLVPAMTEDTHVTVSYRWGVSAPQTWFTVNAEVKAGEGSVSPGAAQVQLGGRATFSFLPAEGWQVADVQVDGESMGARASLVLENVTANRLVEVSFEKAQDPGPDDPGTDPDPDDPGKDPGTDPDPGGDDQLVYRVRASAGQHGAISPEGEVKVVKGADVSFAFVPDKGYRVAKVTVDGKSVGAPSTYLIGDVRADHTIHVEFESVSNAGGDGSGNAGGTGPSGNSGSPGGSAPVKTGDALGATVLGAAVLAVLAGVALVVARRLGRRR